MSPRPFFYDLPPDRIAQRPVHPPDAARMLVCNRATGEIEDSTFSEIGRYLRPGDALVFNNSKVIPARLFGALPGGGEAEILLLKRIADGFWECMGRPLKKFKSGTIIRISERLNAVIKERRGEKEVTVQFESSENACSIDKVIFEIGTMPIPPYIRSGHSDEQDRADYQSIFAKQDGSVAAPTASLHFTESLIHSLKEQGISVHEVTLHVGASSFLTVWDPTVSDQVNKPGVEYYQYDPKVLEELSRVKEKGGRVIAVGTTVARALESMCARKESPDLIPGAFELCSTDLFITPGYEWKILDGLVTNFHQPGTTHLLLVEAFMEIKTVQRVYEEALGSNYRFLSYGDGCCIL